MNCRCRKLSLFFPSGSVGCRCSGTRLSLNFLKFWSDVACHQEPLEGLVHAIVVHAVVVHVTVDHAIVVERSKTLQMSGSLGRSEAGDLASTQAATRFHLVVFFFPTIWETGTGYYLSCDWAHNYDNMLTVQCKM